jgi:AcrR family transcriptional regulator
MVVTAAVPVETALRRDAADNQRKLLEAAVAEFNEHGMDACVEQIAARAGVGIGTFYRRFGTKDALVGRLVEDLLDQLIAFARARIEAGDGTGLEQFLREVATAFVDRRGSLSRLWSGGTCEQVSVVRSLVLELLKIAQHEGTIRADLRANDVTVLMWSLRGIIEIAGDAAGVACQRHLDIALAGMRTGAAPLPHPSLSDRARREALHTPARP